MNIMITGIAGMIGFHAAKLFANRGYKVWGVDNFNPYYDVGLKKERARILKEKGVEVLELDIISDCNLLKSEIQNVSFILHLAAYANPRHSLDEPSYYIDSNIVGTKEIISLAETADVPVVYASSSCVMHGQPLPWCEKDRPSHQNNPYGWSKYVNECQFKHSKVTKSIGLRFFTVYGPYGRPDMALFSFTDAIIKGKPITIYNHGDMQRDFTYVDDIVQGIDIISEHILDINFDGHDIFNIGYGKKVELMKFVNAIEKHLNIQAKYNFAPPHPADVPATWSDTSKIEKLGYRPQIDVEEGVQRFISWYKNFYNLP